MKAPKKICKMKNMMIWAKVVDKLQKVKYIIDAHTSISVGLGRWSLVKHFD